MADSYAARYVSCRVITAQMILAILLARATAASLTGLRMMILPSQPSAKLSLLHDHRIVDIAPMTRSRRIVRSPIFVMPPNRSLPPLEF